MYQKAKINVCINSSKVNTQFRFKFLFPSIILYSSLQLIYKWNSKSCKINASFEYYIASSCLVYKPNTNQ